MTNKQIIYISMTIGSTIGSFLPTMWGDNLFSMSSIVLSVVGGLAGVWFGYKLSA